MFHIFSEKLKILCSCYLVIVCCLTVRLHPTERNFHCLMERNNMENMNIFQQKIYTTRYKYSLLSFKPFLPFIMSLSLSLAGWSKASREMKNIFLMAEWTRMSWNNNSRGKRWQKVFCWSCWSSLKWYPHSLCPHTRKATTFSRHTSFKLA